MLNIVNKKMLLALIIAGTALTQAACSQEDASKSFNTSLQRVKDFWKAPSKDYSEKESKTVVLEEDDDGAYLASRGFEYYAEKKYNTAFTLFMKAAKQGDAEAQSALGTMFRDGHGTSKDYAQARAWYQKAAEQDEPSAQLNLGILYHEGKGGERNDMKAFEWVEKAALLRKTEAEYMLGLFYKEGTGVDLNYVKAKDFFLKSAGKGYSLAQYELGALYYSGNGAGKSYSLAREWWEKAAGENARAQYGLGTLYANGLGVQENLIVAKQWFQKSCNANIKDACTAYHALLQPTPQETPQRRPVEHASPHYYAVDSTAEYANAIALEIEGKHPACRHLASVIRSFGNSGMPAYVRERQIDAVIDKLPSICL